MNGLALGLPSATVLLMDQLFKDAEGLALDDRILEARLVRVENALFFLKSKSVAFAKWDNSEVERLERMRSELHAMYAELHSLGLKSSREQR